MTDDCLFCRIVSGEIPGTIVFRDEQATAFRDINPAAPTHILIVPNKHIASVSALDGKDEQLVGHLFSVAGHLCHQEGVAEGGYRLITNTGPDAGQTVFHIHVHLIGGQKMKHPMG